MYQFNLSSRFLCNLLCFSNHLIDPSNHVERLFRQIIVFSIQNTLRTSNQQSINYSFDQNKVS